MIPKRIFTIWFNEDPELPPMVKRCIESQKIPGYEHRLITLENCYKDSRYIKECLSAKQWVKASDWLRMWYLYTEGGIYLDADMEVLKGKNFDDLLDNRIFLAKEAGGYWANAAIGSEPGHPTIKEYLRRVEDNFRGDGDSIFEPGIRTFTDVFWEADREGLGIKEYPTDYFFPYNHITHEIKITENTRVYHHYMTSWSVKRKAV